MMKMESEEKFECLERVNNNNNNRYLDANDTKAENTCQRGEETLSESFTKEKLEVLEKYLSEFTYETLQRPTIKEVIQMDIELILGKIESLKTYLRNKLKQKCPGPKWRR